jgi:hypothetical protein
MVAVALVTLQYAQGHKKTAAVCQAGHWEKQQWFDSSKKTAMPVELFICDQK